MRKSVSVTNNKIVKYVTELGHIDGDCRELDSNFSPT